MPRAAEQGARLAPLDEAAKIHDADEVGDVIDYGEIVADEKVSEAQLALEPLHQVQDLRLHRDVERRGRLVANQELRVAGQSAGDGDALALPAGELVRELRAVRRRQRSEEHTSELQSLMRISYAVFCLKKKKTHNSKHINITE